MTPKYTQEQIDRVIELRKGGSSLDEISKEVGVSISSVRYFLAQNKVTLTTEQRSQHTKERIQKNDPKALSEQDKQRILELRQQNKPLQEIADLLNTDKSRVKWFLHKSKVTIPEDVAQQNAHQAKLKKNPNAMNDMRAKIDVEYRSEQVRKAYANNEELRNLKVEQTKQWWSSMSDQEKEDYLERRWQATVKSDHFQKYIRRAQSSLDATPEQEFMNRVEFFGGKVVGQYDSSKVRVEVECAKGHRFPCMPNSLQQGFWCPHCANRISKPQKEIAEFIESVCGKQVILSDRKILAPKEIDILVPDMNFGIEFNGLFWHSSAISNYKPASSYHKWAEANEKGVRLVAIFEDEWRDKRELVQDMLKVRLKVASPQKIPARSTVVSMDLDRKLVDDFFEANHIAGSVSHSSAVGLLHDGELVCCASFRTNFNHEFEIARFATKRGVVVQGGLSKILDNSPYDEVYSFSDNRFSNGEVYGKCGFVEIVREGATNSYFYTDGTTRYWRFACRKNNDPEILKEYPTEQAQALGGILSERLLGIRKPFYRIDDAGHRKWKWNRTTKE